ncbi:hypothetical protein K525DRAFT_281734 [Schizophyllum commune Loenen D]|nr:hypothetical protein K525DRAFT_281734 [Schizophyllum commune Loenen D]
MSTSFASRQRARITVTIPKVYEEIYSPVDLEDRALLGTPLDEVYLVQNVVQRVKLVSAKAQVFVVNKDVSEQWGSFSTSNEVSGGRKKRTQNLKVHAGPHAARGHVDSALGAAQLLSSTSIIVAEVWLALTFLLVLHHPHATRYLRQLYRPAFDDAVAAVTRLQNASSGSDKEEDIARLRRWYLEWGQRVDNALSLMYYSSTSRGLPHRLTRNLGLLSFSERERLNQRLFPVWRSDQPEKALGKALRKTEKEQAYARTDHGAWSAVEQVARMAEGRHGMSLGRIQVKRSVWRSA